MGYYDGISGLTVRASSYETARLTDTPVILVVDAAGRSLSVLAALKGFLTYQEDSRIRGVIFNRLSPMLYPGLKDETERLFDVRVIGYVPKMKEFSLESRHLGLVTPEELPGLREEIVKLADRLTPEKDQVKSFMPRIRLSGKNASSSRLRSSEAANPGSVPSRPS